MAALSSLVRAITAGCLVLRSSAVIYAQLLLLPFRSHARQLAVSSVRRVGGAVSALAVLTGGGPSAAVCRGIGARPCLNSGFQGLPVSKAPQTAGQAGPGGGVVWVGLLLKEIRTSALRPSCLASVGQQQLLHGGSSVSKRLCKETAAEASARQVRPRRAYCAAIFRRWFGSRRAPRSTTTTCPACRGAPTDARPYKQLALARLPELLQRPPASPVRSGPAARRGGAGVGGRWRRRTTSPS